MTKQMTKEQVVFLVGAALCLWVVLKLGLFLAQRTQTPGTPLVAASDARPPDSAIGDILATRDLDSYLKRSDTNPFGDPASQATQVFIRALISHSFLRTSLISRYTFDCRMSPSAVRELRFQVPTGLRITDVFCKEIDDTRKWGVDGAHLVVPVNPLLLKRAYYRCQVTVVAQSTFSAPMLWTAPVVSCTAAMPNVQCEVGHIAVAAPGNYIELNPKEAAQTGLTKLALEAVPKELAANSNKLAYSFRQPNYTLTVEVRSKTPVVVQPPTKGPIVRPKGDGPVLKPKEEPVVAQPKEKGPTLNIPTAADAEKLPFKLTAIVRLHEPEPRRQAVLRDKETGEYYRKFEGDVVMADLKVTSITDDAVIVEDAKGKRYKFRGRFEDKYNE
ncbi:MAG TPA: hypothetical protein PLE19_00540 [Planctomycetota bacterium]|nr:hypothetical protein [Planctomycetota bacterium]HRR79250.1 hypothetical protein [Planctomycetota bacterium]HRT94020.1 hypothetical protein [Planctomycetota bacterium]